MPQAPQHSIAPGNEGERPTREVADPRMDLRSLPDMWEVRRHRIGPSV